MVTYFLLTEPFTEMLSHLKTPFLEMVDRGVLDGLPDVLDFWKLKHGISRPSPTSRKCVRNHLSSKDPTWRRWIGVFLTGFLMS